MKKLNNGPSLYHVSDKAISDGLDKISKYQMTSFLKQKGIFVSENISKEDLINYIRKFNFSYSDYLWLTKLLENPNSRIRTELTKLDISLGSEELKTIANTIKSKLSDEDINCKIIKNKDSIRLELNYLEEDLTQSELKQKKNIKSEIEITNDGNSIGFRYGSLDVVKSIKNMLINEIQEKTDNKDIEPIEINLEYIKNPIARSEFFISLSENITGYTFDDILSVDVTKDFNEVTEDEKEDKKEEHLAAIRSAALKGVSVTSTPHFTRLHDDDYYINKIVWSSIEDMAEGNKVVFEAQFGDKERCNNFKYLVKYIYEVAKRSSSIGSHSNRNREITEFDRKKLNSLLETAALDAYKKIIDKYGA